MHFSGNAILDRGALDRDDLARRFATSYRWSRGYGPGAAKVLRRIRRGEPWQSASRAVFPDGSFGNGAAMRSGVLALFHPDDHEALVRAAEESAVITHAHPQGIEGAVLLATSARGLLLDRESDAVISRARRVSRDAEMTSRLEKASSWLTAEAVPSPLEVARTLGNGMTAVTSCATALYLALRHRDLPFGDLTTFIARCGGDVDTIGAMAGSLWGIANGASKLPDIEIEAADDLRDLARRIHEQMTSH